jgi:hypothetical protein
MIRYEVKQSRDTRPLPRDENTAVFGVLWGQKRTYNCNSAAKMPPPLETLKCCAYPRHLNQASSRFYAHTIKNGANSVTNTLSQQHSDDLRVENLPSDAPHSRPPLQRLNYMYFPDFLPSIIWRISDQYYLIDFVRINLEMVF